MIMKHVTIHTNELEKSAGFYMELCGLDIVREINGKKHIMFLAEKKGETCIELIDDSKMQYSGCGLSIGFEVWDAEKYREELISKGITVTEMMRPNPKTSFFFTNDPNGVRIQFISEIV